MHVEFMAAGRIYLFLSVGFRSLSLNYLQVVAFYIYKFGSAMFRISRNACVDFNRYFVHTTRLIYPPVHTTKLICRNLFRLKRNPYFNSNFMGPKLVPPGTPEKIILDHLGISICIIGLIFESVSCLLGEW